MNREEYMKSLGHCLRRLPREDFEKALDYFNEYFDEAGPENEAGAIEDLGSPEAAAAQLICDYADAYAKSEDKDVKKSFSGVWVAMLALFAAPIALPLAFAVAAMGLAVAVAVAAVIFSLFCVVAAMGLSAVACVGVGIWMLFTSPANGIATLGAGLVGLGVGILMYAVCVALTRGFSRLMVRIFHKIAKRGDKK